MSRARYFLLQVIVVAGVFACLGCGKIKGPGFGYVESPRTIVLTPASPASGDVTITYQLIDRELEMGTIILEYSTDNGQTFNSCTLVNPGAATNLESAWHPGKIHSVQWDSVADGLAISGDETVCMRITPSDASNPVGTAGVSGSFTLNNTAYNLPPTASVATPAGVQSGNVQITYSLTDTEGDTCSIEVLYSTNDGTSWQTASMAPAGEGLTGLSSSPAGTAHAFLWDSRADGVAPTGQLDTIKVKITPTDFHVGNAGESNSFSVDNSITNNPPTVNIISGPAHGSTVSTNQVTFGWSGSDSDGSVIGYFYSFDHDPPDVWTTDTSVTSLPLSEGEHSFRVVAMDDDNDLSAVASRVFTVLPAATLEITTTSLPSGIEGQPYSAQLQATGGTPPYTWSCISGSLAAIGLSLDTGTGEITGTATLGSAGLYNFTFRVDDSSGPPQFAQKALSITIFAPGNEWTRDWNDCDFGPDDGNVKLLFEDNMIKLAPEGDVFGSVIDAAHWTQMTPVEFNAGSSGIGEGTAQWQESGGVLYTTDGGTGAWVKVIRREIQYDDADIVLNVSETRAEHKLYVALQRWCLWRDDNNRVSLTYRARSDADWDANLITVAKCIDGTWTKLHEVYYGIHQQVWLRIKHVRGSGTQTFTFYYALVDPEAVPGNWVEYWSGEIYDATHFNENHQLYPTLQIYSDTSSDTDFEPELDKFFQWTGDIPAQRFWPDSPECDIIDSSAGTPEYCLDAGSGGTWTLTGFSAMAFLPGTSTIKFRAAWGDATDRASATWINGGAWMTAAELDTQVAGGALDGHRYVFLQAQFNSDSSDQPVLITVTFTGVSGALYTASEFDTTPSIDDNNEKVIVDSGTAKLAPDGDVFGNVINRWTSMTPAEFNDGWTFNVGSASWFETGGIITNADGGTNEWAIGNRRNGVSYLNADVILHISDTEPAVTSYATTIGLCLWLNNTNWVRLSYRSRSASGSQILVVDRVLDNNWLKLFEGVAGSYNPLWLRIKRIAAGDPGGDNYFYFYTSTDGSSWTLRWSGQIRDASTFNETHSLQPIMLTYCQATPDTFTPEFDKYYQYTGDIPAQRFWNDSPECGIVDSGAADWAFDAGSGCYWQLSDASCVKSEPGTSTVKFKLGGSDTGDNADVFWTDTTWLTISEVKARATVGTYDGYRYIHVKAQFNSDSTDQPTLTSFSIYGAKVP